MSLRSRGHTRNRNQVVTTQRSSLHSENEVPLTNHMLTGQKQRHIDDCVMIEYIALQ